MYVFYFHIQPFITNSKSGQKKKKKRAHGKSFWLRLNYYLHSSSLLTKLCYSIWITLYFLQLLFIKELLKFIAGLFAVCCLHSCVSMPMFKLTYTAVLPFLILTVFQKLSTLIAMPDYDEYAIYGHTYIKGIC